ncbi:MAG: hypothetical protein EA357_07845 [Micavibrio sp.]|nr:MAG: hypothetical protein EA357_07845 [Micavibrio sp.]
MRNEVYGSGGLRLRDRKRGSFSVFRFFGYMLYSWKLMAVEKEVILFIFLQWLTACLGLYMLLAVLLDPKFIFMAETAHATGTRAAWYGPDFIIWVWGTLCITVVALPFSIFASCIPVVHIIHHYEGRQSTISECMRVVLARVGSLWFFVWVDLYLTIFKPHYSRYDSWPVRLVKMALYEAWKVAAMSIHMNILTGRSWSELRTNTVELVKQRGWEMLGIRIGYLLVNGILFLAAWACLYWGLPLIFPVSDAEGVGVDNNSTGANFVFCLLLIVLWLALINIFSRPAYLIAMSDIFADYIYQKPGDEHVLPEKNEPVSWTPFFIYAVLIVTVFSFPLAGWLIGIGQ